MITDLFFLVTKDDLGLINYFKDKKFITPNDGRGVYYYNQGDFLKCNTEYNSELLVSIEDFLIVSCFLARYIRKSLKGGESFHIKTSWEFLMSRALFGNVNLSCPVRQKDIIIIYSKGIESKVFYNNNNLTNAFNFSDLVEIRLINYLKKEIEQGVDIFELFKDSTIEDIKSFYGISSQMEEKKSATENISELTKTVEEYKKTIETLNTDLAFYKENSQKLEVFKDSILNLIHTLHEDLSIETIAELYEVKENREHLGILVSLTKFRDYADAIIDGEFTPPSKKEVKLIELEENKACRAEQFVVKRRIVEF